MNVSDILTVAPDGRQTVAAPQGRSALLPRDCTVHATGWLVTRMIGPLTGGYTTPSGIGLQESILGWLTVETVCHEATHWWQCNRRMGQVQYVVTYLWHMLLSLGQSGAHWHDTHPMEVEARRCAAAMILSTDAVIDIEAWLSVNLPATR